MHEELPYDESEHAEFLGLILGQIDAESHNLLSAFLAETVDPTEPQFIPERTIAALWVDDETREARWAEMESL